MCQSQSPNSSYSPCPPGNHKFVLYASDSISAWQIISSILFVYSTYMLIYNICFSLSDLHHSVSQSLGLSTSLQMIQFPSFFF